MGGGATPDAGPKLGEKGFLTKAWDAAVNWLDKEFASPKLTPVQQAAAYDKFIEEQNKVKTTSNPIVSLVRDVLPGTSNVAHKSMDRAAQIEDIVNNDGNAPAATRPSTTPKP